MKGVTEEVRHCTEQRFFRVYILLSYCFSCYPVSELEYIKFMLVAMKKIDGELFDDLRDQFDRLDLTGDGKAHMHYFMMPPTIMSALTSPFAS